MFSITCLAGKIRNWHDLGVDKIRENGRSAQGVTLIRCGDDDLVTSGSLLPPEDEEVDE